MVGSKWYESFVCVLISSMVYVLCIWFFANITDFKKEEEYSPKKTYIIVGVNIFMLTGVVISYIMTQFLNPGIINPSTLTE